MVQDGSVVALMDGGGLMTIEYVWFVVAPVESVSLSVTGYVPVAVGVPEIVAVVGPDVRARPGGSAPVNVQTNGGVPGFALTVALYGTLISPLGTVPLI